MSVIPKRVDPRDERGVMLVLFAILLPLLLVTGALVIDASNWWVHGKHLQTKVDAAAFAGGGDWSFPCAADVDARIETTARRYFGPHTTAAGANFASTFNPQTGGTAAARMHVVLNASEWWDDSAPEPFDFTAPVGSVCAAESLDVKGTEQDTSTIFGWLPFYPEIRRKARVEIQEAEGITGLLPIAVRAPEPVSAAAVFYDEQSAQKTILAVKYFVKKPSIFGLPANLQGWSTENTADVDPGTGAPRYWASFSPGPTTGVAIAVSFRGACATSAPPGVTTTAAPCLEDNYIGSSVNQLCNQAASTQIVNCYYTDPTQKWPSENVLSGLHFIRGYPLGNVTNGPPQLRGAYLQNVSCTTNGYFNAKPNGTCASRLRVTVDLGSVLENPPPNPPNTNVQTRIAGNFEVHYKLVRANGTVVCNFGANCLLQTASGPNAVGNIEFSTQGTASSPDLQLAANSLGNSVAVEIRMKGSSANPNPGNCGVNLSSFGTNCRWYYTGNGQFSTSTAPTPAQVLAAPVQRAFRGNSLASGSTQWLRLTSDQNCDSAPEAVDNEAASQPTGGQRCFVVDMGLKGGVAKDQDEEPILFNDGVGSSQMGGIDCDPNIPQGQVLVDGVVQGCGPWYAANRFNTNPLCPAPNSIFSTPNPGSPWTDWPPLRCIKTRTSSASNQLQKGFDIRFFGSNKAPCTADSATGWVKGRNYWDKDNNLFKGASYADDGPPATGNNLRADDPRLVTIFLAPTEAFTGSGQEVFPLTGFLSVYITGYGRINGSGLIDIDDPCPGSSYPTDLDLSGGNSGGYAVWGHVLKNVIPSPNATPSGAICNPGASLQPCVATLVE